MTTEVNIKMDLVQYLIDTGEAVEYGEPWTDKTTHEWWTDANGDRQVRLVMTYHGGGCRGDDDTAEYVRRLLDRDMAVEVDTTETIDDEYKGIMRRVLPEKYTHIVHNGVPHRIRYYMPAPSGVSDVASE